MAYAGEIVKYSGLFLIGASQMVAAETYKWEQAVTLQGEIKIEKFYGPPNFGETPKVDQKINIPILYAEQPFDIEGVSYDIPSQIKNQHKVQLIILDDQLYKKITRGKCVKVTGTIVEAISGHHHTAVLLNVSSITSCLSQ